MGILRTKSYKPLSISVNASSIMIVPPTGQFIGDSSNSVTVKAFAASTAYNYGDIIRTTTNGYFWVIVAGTTTTTEPTHTDGDAANGTATLRAVRWSRNILTITNTSSVTVYISRGTAAEAGKGIMLTQNGVMNEGYSGPLPYDGPWYAIGAGTGVTLAISEG